MSTSPTSALDERLSDLFGEGVDWRLTTGLIHVLAIGARPRVPIAVGPGAPESATDRFVLGFARARADVIVTTGAILRAEPDLVHRTADDPGEEAAWRRWRADVLGRPHPPRLLVLTRSAEFPLAHPALRGPTRPLVWTGEQGRARLAAASAALEVVGGSGGRGADGRRSPPAPSGDHRHGETSAALELSAAVRWLREELGARTIVLEAGPAATRELYPLGKGRSGAGPLETERSAGLERIDELLLSLFGGPAFPAVGRPAVSPPGIASAAEGPPAAEAFPSSEALAAYFAPGATASAGGAAAPQPRTRRRVEETSGVWVFERYRRAESR